MRGLLTEMVTEHGNRRFADSALIFLFSSSSLKLSSSCYVGSPLSKLFALVFDDIGQYRAVSDK